MKFIASKEVFEKLPDLSLGVVVAYGVDNHTAIPEVEQMLVKSIDVATSRFQDVKVKEDPSIVPYREAFRTLGINPNKYMCSAEALFTRIAKGKGMPHINPLVDLNNAISLEHTIPMGTHEVVDGQADIEIRFATGEEIFVPFGGEGEEHPDVGELIYAVGNDVRTRRWTWRQSDHGKITEDTVNVFYPLDAFKGINEEEMLKARDELAEKLQTLFGAEVVIGLVDAEHPEFDFGR